MGPAVLGELPEHAAELVDQRLQLALVPVDERRDAVLFAEQVRGVDVPVDGCPKERPPDAAKLLRPIPPDFELFH